MRFLASLAEQAMGSLITFGVNIWLIRNGRSDSYGVYVFWFSVSWVLSTCQFTLAVVHLSSLPAGSNRLAERREPEQVLFSATLIVLALAALGVLTANQFLTTGGLAQMPAVLFVPGFLLYQYVRAFAFSRQRVLLSAGLTGAVMVTAGCGLVGEDLAGMAPDASRVLLVVGLAYAVCAGVALFLLDPTLRPAVRRSALRRYVGYLRGSGWLILGAGSNETTSRLYSFAVVDWFGTTALAGLSAVQVVIRPAWMLSAAWTSLGFPALATQRSSGDRRGFVGTMLGGGLGTAALTALWSGVVIVAWPWISQVLYRGRYGDIGILAWLWGANAVLGSIAVALNTGMLVLGEFRQLAMIDFIGALATAGGMFVVLGRFDAEMTVAATLAGQSTQILLMATLLSRRLRPDGALAAAVQP